MSSETAAPAAEEQPPYGSLNRTLVIGLGARGAELCRRVIEYSSGRSGPGPAPRVSCISIGFTADGLPAACGECSFIELKDPGIISADDYAALREQEVWSWLPVQAAEEGLRIYSRMAFFNAAAEIRAELLRLKTVFNQEGQSPRSIFIAAGAGETAGNSAFLDMAALACDVFADSSAPAFYGMLLLPGYGSTPQQRAEAYALLKETDYFLQGGKMNFVYPDGSSAVMSGKVFSSGNLFIIDSKEYNAAASGADNTNIENAARFIEMMTVPAVSGAVAAHRSPASTGRGNRGMTCLSTPGICLGLNPDAACRDALAAHVTAGILDEFFKPVDPGELLHELERIKKISGSPCGPACADILHKVHPAHAGQIESVAAEIRGVLDRVSGEDDPGKAADVFREIADTYSAHGIEKFRYGLISAMQIRISIELEKTKILLLPEIYQMLNDPAKGFYFTLAALDSISGRLSSFYDLFRSSAEKIKIHTADEMLCGFIGSVHETARALEITACFNYRQFVYSCMIEASMDFLEKFIFFLSELRHTISEKIVRQAAELRDGSRSRVEELLRGLQHAAPGTSLEGGFLSGAALPGIDAYGAAGMLKPAGILTDPAGGEGMEYPDISRFREQLSSAVNSFIDSELSGVTLLQCTDNAGDLAARMLVLSEPALQLHNTAAPGPVKSSMLFTCDNLTVDAVQPVPGLNSGMLQVITHADFNRSCEAVMISLVSGFKLRDVNRLEDFSGCYHEITASMKPLHLFNGTDCNAVYFPDPLGREYIDPSKLWSALLLLKLVREENGVYTVDESLDPLFRENGARVKYKKVVTDAGRRLVEEGTSGPASFELIADAVNMLGMLAKGSGGGIVFRKEYASAIRDILDAQSHSASENSPRVLHREVFSTTADIAAFLAENELVKEFILNSIKSIIAATGLGSAYGAFVMLPASRIAQTPVPSFDSAGSFADYCLDHGSPGFYSAVRNILVVKLDEYISARFVRDSGTPASSLAGMTEFLRAVEPRIPLCVINTVRGRYGIMP